MCVCILHVKCASRKYKRNLSVVNYARNGIFPIPVPVNGYNCISLYSLSLDTRPVSSSYFLCLNNSNWFPARFPSTVLPLLSPNSRVILSRADLQEFGRNEFSKIIFVRKKGPRPSVVYANETHLNSDKTAIDCDWCDWSISTERFTETRLNQLMKNLKKILVIDI